MFASCVILRSGVFNFSTQVPLRVPLRRGAASNTDEPTRGVHVNSISPGWESSADHRGEVSLIPNYYRVNSATEWLTT